jgi:hypothetical protein
MSETVEGELAENSEGKLARDVDAYTMHHGKSQYVIHTNVHHSLTLDVTSRGLPNALAGAIPTGADFCHFKFTVT